MPSDSNDHPPTTAAMLERTVPNYQGQLTHVATIPARDGTYVDPQTVLRPELAAPFQAAIGNLYTHQATALDQLADGENVCVSTSTSSGKTYIYALQAARNYLKTPDATALFVYPTKALSRDQQQELTDFFEAIGVDLDVRVYDGDTPQDRRQTIRETADIIITNFAGVNAYLASHPRWHTFLDSCALVAIDESHTYTGVHGMHVAWTIRRLRRLLGHYGSDPQFVCTSATIGNPEAHSQRLTGASFSVVVQDGSPRGQREIAFWQPPIDSAELAPDADYEDYRDAQRSPLREGATILTQLGDNGLQTLMFTRSRTGAELSSKYAEQVTHKQPTVGQLQVAPYHAGLGKETRRGIEHRFKTGQLDGVTATNALELGIDIGSIDATILTGYPGTRQSFWQQVGRSGRGTADALSVFVARSDAIDQYLLEHPDYVLGDAIEDAVINLANNTVYAQHLLAAAHERPLTTADRRWFDGQRLDRGVKMWTDAGQLAGELSRGVRYTGSPTPQLDISLYASSDTQFVVRCPDGEIDIEPIDKERAYRDFHAGALFLHNGAQYEVIEFNETAPQPYVTVQEVSTREYTQTQSTKTIQDVVPSDTRDLGNGYTLGWGTGTVQIHYTHYQRKAIQTGTTTAPLQPTGLDPIELRTQLMWVDTPQSLVETVLQALTDTDPAMVTNTEVQEIVGGGLHGAEHGMIKLTPLELRMDKSDLGGLSTVDHPETNGPTWFIHDAVDGGLGFSKRIYEQFASIATRTRDRVAGCECQGTNGCPACIMDSQCGNQNRFLHTAATVFILDQVLEQLS